MPTATFPELKTVSMREGVADRLRDAILQGHFQAGECLLELSLATQMKISRGPVREALLMLAQDGLVTHSQNKGFSVIELSPEDRLKMLQVRLPLETLALEMAAKQISEADLLGLRQLRDEIIETFRSGDFAATTRLDLAFHSTIWEKSGNEWLVMVLKRVMVPYFAFTMIYTRKDPAMNEQTLAQLHDLYLDFLSGKTSRSAEECVRSHLSLDSA